MPPQDTIPTDWRDIYRQFDPMEPLGATDPRLYEGLFGDFIDDVATRLLLHQDRNHKLLLSGHVGCGKSTFLNLLQEHPEIKERFFLVKYSIKDLLDPNDATHIDILLSLVIQTLITLSESTDNRITIDRVLEKQVKDLYQELAGLLQREEETTRRRSRQTGGGIEAGAGLKNIILWFKGNLNARFQLENDIREKVRQHFRPKLTDFLKVINTVLVQTRAALGDKRLLILIDDTDKIPPTQGLDIFFTHGQHLSVPQANIVFMVDTSLSCSSKYAAVVSKIGSEEFFPAIKTIEQNALRSKTTRANYARLRDLARQRAGQDFIAPAALNKAIEMSGGVVRELIRIMQEAIFRARGRVQTTHVEDAVIRIRNGYNLFSDHIRVLQAVLEAPNWLQTYEGDTAPSETTLLDLLHMPALFQYRNGEDKWYRPYPIFIPWLKKLQS